MRAMAIVALFCFTGAAVAEEKKADAKKQTGNWTKESNGFKLKFAFKKDDVLVFTMDNGNNDMCEMTSKCTFEKGNMVKCEVTKYEKKGQLPDIKEGFKFKFKFEAKDKKAKLESLEGENINNEAKEMVEGDYEKATD